MPALVLISFIFLSFSAAQHESATYDEPAHITSGYTFWKTGVYLDPFNGPFIRLWLSAPLLALPLASPQSFSSWSERKFWPFAAQFFNENRLSPETLLKWSRIMILFLGVFQGILVWHWTRQWGGHFAAFWALVFHSFCPTILAYSHLATTDLGLSFLCFLA